MIQDRQVRARTRSGRLAALDRWLVGAEASLTSPGATVVDFGFGATPVTTDEMAEALGPRVNVIGVEQSVDAVGAARGHGAVRFMAGGFETLATLKNVSVVRAMNVLRGYPAHEVEGAHAALASPLIDGGIVIEGSADAAGDIVVAYVLRKRAGNVVVREALLFYSTFAHGTSPWQFRDYLPRDWRRETKPGSAMHDFLKRWHTHLFAHTVAMPSDTTFWGAGGVRWAPADGVPVPAPRGSR